MLQICLKKKTLLSIITAALKQKNGENNMQISMEISQEGKQLIKKFEGCKLKAYKCCAEMWTIGLAQLKILKMG